LRFLLIRESGTKGTLTAWITAAVTAVTKRERFSQADEKLAGEKTHGYIQNIRCESFCGGRKLPDFGVDRSDLL
jgi:hypothetical protein